MTNSETESEVALIRARLKSGATSDVLVEVAAFCGHPAARIVVSPNTLLTRQKFRLGLSDCGVTDFGKDIGVRFARATVAALLSVMNQSDPKTESLLRLEVGYEEPEEDEEEEESPQWLRRVRRVAARIAELRASDSPHWVDELASVVRILLMDFYSDIRAVGAWDALFYRLRDGKTPPTSEYDVLLDAVVADVRSKMIEWALTHTHQPRMQASDETSA